MPDHIHALWQLPNGDADYAARWSLLKSSFSRGIPAAKKRSTSKIVKREKGVWQRRYWERAIRDDADFERHVNYIHSLDTYVFDPAAGRGTIKFGLLGAFRFVSGRLTKLASADVRVTTPVAIIGIRGTEFWGGPIDDQALGVFLIEGAVSVSNAAGQQILSQRGQGTNIAAPGAAPGPVTFWPPDKVDRAMATVAFR
ncbi:MAG: transposase [Rhizobiales bacterium]|nr:transposase [Hyphomicrobiales bacterium]